MSNETVTYYAIVGNGETIDNPYGIARRREWDTGLVDEAMGKDLRWHGTGIIAEWERASFDDELEEISEEKANQIIEKIRTAFG